MAAIEQYWSVVPDWGTAVEFVVHEPEGVTALGDVQIPQSLFLIAVASTPNGFFPAFLDTQVRLLTPTAEAH